MMESSSEKATRLSWKGSACQTLSMSRSSSEDQHKGVKQKADTIEKLSKGSRMECNTGQKCVPPFRNSRVEQGT